MLVTATDIYEHGHRCSATCIHTSVVRLYADFLYVIESSLNLRPLSVLLELEQDPCHCYSHRNSYELHEARASLSFFLYIFRGHSRFHTSREFGRETWKASPGGQALDLAQVR